MLFIHVVVLGSSISFPQRLQSAINSSDCIMADHTHPCQYMIAFVEHSDGIRMHPDYWPARRVKIHAYRSGPQKVLQEDNTLITWFYKD